MKLIAYNGIRCRPNSCESMVWYTCWYWNNTWYIRLESTSYMDQVAIMCECVENSHIGSLL